MARPIDESPDPTAGVSGETIVNASGDDVLDVMPFVD
jgi:hypothetical protein